MTDQTTTADGVHVLNLQALIRARTDERGWTYSDLERLSGGKLSRGRWHQLATGVRMERFPEPETIKLLADVLAVDATAVVLACAATLGIPVRGRGSDLAQLLPSGTDHLSERMRDAILSIVRAAVAESLTSEDGPDSATPGGGELFGWPQGGASRGRNDLGQSSDSRA